MNRKVGVSVSPEVVKMIDASPLAVEFRFRELDEAFLQKQAKIWLGEVLRSRLDEEMPIADLLADGELLFQVSKEIWKMLLNKYPDLQNSQVYIHGRTSLGKTEGGYMPYPKVDSFSKVCKILGVPAIDMFSSSDVVQKRNTRKVCMCLRSLSKKARVKNLNVPDFDNVAYTIVMPTIIVGGIRRNLESQCCSSSSSGYSPSIDNKERSSSGRHGQPIDLLSDCDEAESSFKELAENEFTEKDYENVQLECDALSEESSSNDCENLHKPLSVEDVCKDADRFADIKHPRTLDANDCAGDTDLSCINAMDNKNTKDNVRASGDVSNLNSIPVDSNSSGINGIDDKVLNEFRNAGNISSYEDIQNQKTDEGYEMLRSSANDNFSTGQIMMINVGKDEDASKLKVNLDLRILSSSQDHREVFSKSKHNVEVVALEPNHLHIETPEVMRNLVHTAPDSDQKFHVHEANSSLTSAQEISHGIVADASSSDASKELTANIEETKECQGKLQEKVTPTTGGMKGETRKPKNKAVVRSVAGGMTLVGSVLLFLHLILRQKKPRGNFRLLGAF